MKKCSIALFLLILNFSHCCSQTKGWLRSDRNQFEKLLPLLGKYNDSLKIQPTKSVYSELTEDTLSIGKWSGACADIASPTNAMTIFVAQTKPYIKGRVEIFYQGVEGSNTGFAQFIGKDSASTVRLILYYGMMPSFGYQFNFLEGKVYTIATKDNKTEKIFCGLGESGFGKKPSKLGFLFHKEE
jgi:hypothetical protein